MLTIFTNAPFGTHITMVTNSQSEASFLGPEMDHSSIDQQMLLYAITYVRTVDAIQCTRLVATTGLCHFPFLDKFLCLFLERSLQFLN